MANMLDASNFSTTIASAKPVIVDFYADWCGPCKMLSPVIDEIANENPDIGVYKINVDENQAIAAQYSVMSIPTIVSFKNGEAYKRVVGVCPKGDILDLVK